VVAQTSSTVGRAVTARTYGCGKAKELRAKAREGKLGNFPGLRL